MDSPKKIVTKKGKIKLVFPHFHQMVTSTQTVIITTNMVSDTEKLHLYLPYWGYIKPKRKKDPNPNDKIPPGSIISKVLEDDVIGFDFRKKKKKKEIKKNSFYRNAVSVKMLFGEKRFDIKIPKLGEIQITGVQNNNQISEILRHLYLNIRRAEKLCGEELIYFRKLGESNFPCDRMMGISRREMNNYNFAINYNIDREKLNSFFHNNTNFKSIYDGSLNTSVNIKHECDPIDRDLELFEVSPSGHTSTYTKIPYDGIKHLLKEKIKKEERYCSFIIFATGSAILSGTGKDIERIYNQFKDIMMKNREIFEEKIC